MGTRTNPQICVWLWQLEPIEKDAAHFIVIMLAGVHEDFLMLLPQLPAHGSSLDKLRPRSDDGGNFHFIPSQKRSVRSALPTVNLGLSWAEITPLLNSKVPAYQTALFIFPALGPGCMSVALCRIRFFTSCGQCIQSYPPRSLA